MTGGLLEGRAVTGTTETLVDGDSSWSLVGSLFVPTSGIRAITLNNTIFAIGIKIKLIL